MKILLLKTLEHKKYHIKRIEMPDSMTDPYLWAALHLGWHFYKHKDVDPLWFLSTHNIKRIVIATEADADENERKLKGEKI